jgi:hypothetical protein
MEDGTIISYGEYLLSWSRPRWFRRDGDDDARPDLQAHARAGGSGHVERAVEEALERALIRRSRRASRRGFRRATILAISSFAPSSIAHLQSPLRAHWPQATHPRKGCFRYGGSRS